VRSSLAWATAAVALISALLAGAAAGATELPPLAGRCSVPNVHATTFRFKTGDGVLLDGAVIGQGRVGIVLAHESVGDLCNWVFEGNLLSRQGLRVLMFDYRGFGLSAKVTGSRAARIDLDIAGAIGELRRRGSQKIVLVGASLGGAAVLAAAASARPPLAGVVCISAPDSAFLRGDQYAVLDSTAAAARVRTPLLFLAASNDPFVPVRATRKLYQVATVKDKRLVVVPGYSHGVGIVGDGGSKLRNLIVTFIRDHAGS